MTGYYDNGESGGMIGKGNRSTRRKPAPIPLCPPQTPHACLDANSGRRGRKPATNRLSYGTALEAVSFTRCLKTPLAVMTGEQCFSRGSKGRLPIEDLHVNERTVWNWRERHRMWIWRLGLTGTGWSPTTNSYEDCDELLFSRGARNFMTGWIFELTLRY
jgi:hypothetical protein